MNVEEITYQLYGNSKLRRVILVYPYNVNNWFTHKNKRIAGSAEFFDDRGRRILIRSGLTNKDVIAIAKQVKKLHRVIIDAKR